MAMRIVTGVSLAAATIALIVLGNKIVYYVAITAIAIIAQYEIFAAQKSAGEKPIEWPCYAFAVLYVPAMLQENIEGIFALYIMAIMATFMRFILGRNFTVKDVFSSLTGLIYPLPFFVFLALAINQRESIWQTIIWTSLSIPLITDTGAYFGGSKFGKHKLCPHISPKKTIEGAVCGLTLGIAAGAVLFNLQIFWGGTCPLVDYLIIAALASVAGQIGDLAASALKRHYGVKDFGNLLPGHGGVLDRIDSILFSLPICFMYFQLFVI